MPITLALRPTRTHAPGTRAWMNTPLLLVAIEKKQRKAERVRRLTVQVELSHEGREVVVVIVRRQESLEHGNLVHERGEMEQYGRGT